MIIVNSVCGCDLVSDYEMISHYIFLIFSKLLLMEKSASQAGVQQITSAHIFHNKHLKSHGKEA